MLVYECFDLLLCIFWNVYSIETTHVGMCKLLIYLSYLLVILYAYQVNLCAKNSTFCMFRNASSQNEFRFNLLRCVTETSPATLQ